MDGVRSQRSSAGFTLIEAMISMFFIAFIVGEMAMVSGHARRSSAYARHVTEANMLADGILEKSRNTAYTNLNTRFSALDSPPDPIVFDLTKDGVLEQYSESCSTSGTVTTCTCTADLYTITRTVTPFLPSAAVAFASSTAADIDVAVRWTDDRGAAHQVRVSTVRAKF